MYYSIRLYFFICDDCKTNAKFSDVQEARTASWAISKNHDACYCPSCAPAHRNTGRGGVKNGVSKMKPLKNEPGETSPVKKLLQKIFYARKRRKNL